MISVDEAVIARLDSHGKHFEIMVHPERALDVRKGKDIPIDDLVAYREVYEDAEKGKKVSNEELNKIFGTNDFEEIAYEIIRNGDVQITTEQKKKMRQEKKKEIASRIARRAVNPQTNNPHPQKRILNAMDETGVHVDAMKDVSDQINDVIDKIRPVLPISIEEIKIAVRVPPKYAGKASGNLREIGKIKKEEWKNDGSWMAVIKMPAGLQNDFYDQVNSITKGEAETKIVNGDK